MTDVVLADLEQISRLLGLDWVPCTNLFCLRGRWPDGDPCTECRGTERVWFKMEAR